MAATTQKPSVVFVLGGPGAGKGTQCKRIVKDFGFVHLSAGDLLREERKKTGEVGTLIANYIKEGKIVPVEITVRLLKGAMERGIAESGNFRYLIDGFPRNQDNLDGWNKIMGDFADVKFVLFLDCPEAVMEQRLLGRNEGRTDDNIESIKKRFAIYQKETQPILALFDKEGKCRKINSDRSIDAIFDEVTSAFAEFKPSESKVQERDVKHDFNNAMRKALSTTAADVENGKEAAKVSQFCDLAFEKQGELVTQVVKETLFNPKDAKWTVSGVSRFNLSGGVVVSAKEGETEHTVYVNGYGVLEQWKSPLLPLPEEGLLPEQEGGCALM